MKKLIAIVAVLMLLVAFIGLDRIGDMLRVLVRDDRDPRANPGEEIAYQTPAIESTGDDQRGVRMAASTVESESFQGDRTSVVLSDDSVERGAPEQIPLSISGDMSPFHFIRSSEVLGAIEPTEQQRALLRTATEAVLGTLNSGVIIFDADVTSQFGSPVLVFAREELELTKHVKTVYETLLCDPLPVNAEPSP